jgi:nucleotide-binding universal stress UspA family protein
MNTNVIAGVDGHEGGRDAAALAMTLAGGGARCTLVFIATTLTPRAGPHSRSLGLADAGNLPRVLADEVRIVGRGAQVVRTQAASVSPGLEDTTERRRADRIAVGASRRHGLPRLAAGGDAISLLHRTPVTVAIAPRGYSRDPRLLARIEVAFDGSEQSIAAEAYAVVPAEAKHYELVARRVLKPAGDVPTWNLVAPGRPPIIEPERPGAFSERVEEITVQTVTGPRHRQLVRLSREVDLLVCGSRRSGAVRRLVLGSTSDHMARRVKRSVADRRIHRHAGGLRLARAPRRPDAPRPPVTNNDPPTNPDP